MPTYISTKEDLYKAILNHCGKMCKNRPESISITDCGETGCPLYPHRLQALKPEENFDIFRVNNRDDFMRMVLQSAKEVNCEVHQSTSGYVRGFFWSDLRNHVNATPLNKNWWGGAAHMLKGNGFKIHGEMIRPSTIQGRKGYDRFWEKTVTMYTGKAAE